MFMPNFSSPASTQTDMAKFWNFFKKILEFFKKFFSEFQKIPNLSMQFQV
jgi:hypothetical protein